MNADQILPKLQTQHKRMSRPI